MSIVTEKNALTAEELQTLKSLQKQFQSVQFELGEIEVFKIQTEERYEYAKKYLKDAQQQEKEFTQTLKEKYGDITLNLETGEFSKSEQNV